MSRQDIAELEGSFEYAFKNRSLLIEALTHKTYHHENPKKAPRHNERLEFLGDSVLSLVIVEYLYRSDRDFSESVMAKIKSFLVKESILSEIAIGLSLGSFILLGRGENDTGGRNKKSILSNALEAVFGAIYIDSGYEAVKKVILTLFKDKIDAAVSSGQFFDFKTDLQEESQLRFGVLPEYRVVKQEGKEHKKIFTVEVFIKGNKLGIGTGGSKKEAEIIAAKEALSKIKSSGNVYS